MKKGYTAFLWIVFICILPLAYIILKFLLQDEAIKQFELVMVLVPYIFGLLTIMYRLDIKFYFVIQRILRLFRNDYTSWVLSIRYENICNSGSVLLDIQSLLLKESCKMIKFDSAFLSVLWDSRHIVNLRLENMDGEFSLHFYTSKMDVPIKSNTKKIKSLSRILDMLENIINMVDRNLKKYELEIHYPDSSPYYSYWIKSLPEERIITFSCSVAIDGNDVIDVNKNRIRIFADTLHSLFSKVDKHLTLRGN